MPTAPKAAATAATMQAISVVNYSTHTLTHTHTLGVHTLHVHDKVVRKENFDFHATERALPLKNAYIQPQPHALRQFTRHFIINSAR